VRGYGSLRLNPNGLGAGFDEAEDAWLVLGWVVLDRFSSDNAKGSLTLTPPVCSPTCALLSRLSPLYINPACTKQELHMSKNEEKKGKKKRKISGG
jgi:hypothetical protein